MFYVIVHCIVYIIVHVIVYCLLSIVYCLLLLLLFISLVSAYIVCIVTKLLLDWGDSQMQYAGVMRCKTLAASLVSLIQKIRGSVEVPCQAGPYASDTVASTKGC